MKSNGNISAVLMIAAIMVASIASAARPNVVLIITDDQGYGDLGVNGNPVVRTPNIDAFAADSARINSFYVSPVCSPTRASLLTGRYNYRTGVVDTFVGRSMMHPDETTLAELLRGAGYRTGIFGKWHLGDNYPLRAIDQGFDVAVVHKGGGIGQPSDPPDGSGYFDPVVYRNGAAGTSSGYCTDVFTDAAIDFVRGNSGAPFFAYIAYNAPHTPLEIGDEYAKPYRSLGMKPQDFPANEGWPFDNGFDVETTSKIYGMISNVDENVGRLLRAIDQSGARENTIVIFMTDNGPQQPRFNAGLRGLKGTVFEGGIRVPFFVRWPGSIEAGRVIDTPGAHIDITPTLLDACGVRQPGNSTFDGVTLLPIWIGESTAVPTRSLVFQWHRGDAPEKYRALALRRGQYKLVQPNGVQPGAAWDANALMLFDIENDPFEKQDLAAELPYVVAELRSEYDAWFDNVCASRGFDPVRIIVGSTDEASTELNRQDWRGPNANWGANGIGEWYVTIAHAGVYHAQLRFPETTLPARATLRIGELMYIREIVPGNTELTIGSLPLVAGETTISAEISEGDERRGAHYVTIERGSSAQSDSHRTRPSVDGVNPHNSTTH